jgi:hypothetical protein
MVDRKIPEDETPDQRREREAREAFESRPGTRADTGEPPLEGGTPVPPMLEETWDQLPEETQQEASLGAAKVAQYSGAGLPEQEVFAAAAPGLTTEEPGAFIQQESAASPVGTEPNPPEGVTPLTHTPIDPAPITDEEHEGLDAKERKQLYEAQRSRSPNDTRPAAEIANELQAQKDAELEQRRKNRGGDDQPTKKPAPSLAERVNAAKTPASGK